MMNGERERFYRRENQRALVRRVEEGGGRSAL